MYISTIAYCKGTNEKTENMENLVTVKDAANYLNVSIDTIRRWDKKGLIQSSRTKNNYRIFDLDELTRAKKKINGNATNIDFKILKDSPKGFKCIELFSGAGGLALGLENAGFQTELLLEIDDDSCKTLKQNRPDWNVIKGDIKKFTDDGGFDNYNKGEIDLLAGGFPCQAFSYAGKKMGFEDARGTLFFEFARVARKIRPKVLLAENVKGLVRHDDGRTLKTMVNALQEIGYRVSYKVLKSQFLDVPQKRERLFLIAINEDSDLKQFYFPKEKNYIITLREAFKGIPDSEGYKYSGRKKEIMKMVPEGGYWKDLPIEVQKEYMKKSFYLGGGKTGMARRLSFSEPSLTLVTNPSMKQTERGHPIEDRPINIRESARIQSFPDNWVFEGALNSQYKQIGNAVPVNMAYHIGKSLIGILEDKYDKENMVVGNEVKFLPEQMELV